MQVFSTDFRPVNLGPFTTSIIGAFFGDRLLLRGVDLLKMGIFSVYFLLRCVFCLSAPSIHQAVVEK